MTIEIDTGVWVETNSMTAVTLHPEGAVIAVIDGVSFTVTRFSFEQMLDLLKLRDAQQTELAF